MSIQQIWQNFIYIFRCFNPIRKPEYIRCDDDDLDYDKLPEYHPSNTHLLFFRD